MVAELRRIGAAWPVVASGEHFGVAVDGVAVSALSAWLDLLIEWNRTHDLTAARSEEELVDLMLADALVLSRAIPEAARVVDVGSGAGAPGLPLALLRTDLRVTLVEPLAKRSAFLRTATARLQRLDVRIERKKGAEIEPGWDAAISRATLPPPAWLDLGASLVRRGGDVWVLLAREPAPAIAVATLAEEIDYVWPSSGSSRRALRYRVTAP